MSEIILVKNHETGEEFQIVSLAKFIEWLNDVDDVFSFSIRESYE